MGATPTPTTQQKVLNQILARRVLIILGKGGVGKTTVSAALPLVTES